jgi:hypothetical protein
MDLPWLTRHRRRLAAGALAVLMACGVGLRSGGEDGASDVLVPSTAPSSPDPSASPSATASASVRPSASAAAAPALSRPPTTPAAASPSSPASATSQAPLPLATSRPPTPETTAPPDEIRPGYQSGALHLLVDIVNGKRTAKRLLELSADVLVGMGPASGTTLPGALGAFQERAMTGLVRRALVEGECVEHYPQLDCRRVDQRPVIARGATAYYLFTWTPTSLNGSSYTAGVEYTTTLRYVVGEQADGTPVTCVTPPIGFVLDNTVTDTDRMTPAEALDLALADPAFAAAVATSDRSTWPKTAQGTWVDDRVEGVLRVSLREGASQRYVDVDVETGGVGPLTPG